MNLYSLKNKFNNILKKINVGATAMEYVLIASLITVVAVAGYKAVGNGYSRIYNNISEAISN